MRGEMQSRPATFILTRSFGIAPMKRDAADDSTEKTEA